MTWSQHNGLYEFIVRTTALTTAWLTSWELGEVQQLVGIVSGLVLLGYTLAQWRALRKREKQQEDKQT